MATTPRISTSVAALICGAFCGLIYVLTAGYGDVSGDVNATDVLSWQLATTGNSTFAPDTFPGLDQHPLRGVWIVEATDGHEVIGRSPGAVVAAVPAYWALGGKDFSVVPAALTAAFLTSTSVILLAFALQRYMPERDAVLASLAFGLSTPVWSVAANGMWPHTITVLGLCGMTWAASRERWWLAGLFGGVAIWGRLHVVIVVAIVGLLVGARRRDTVPVIHVGLASAALLALMCVWTRVIYGSWSPTSSYGLGVSDNPFNTDGNPFVNQLGFWVSLDRGLLVWSPVIVLLLPALARSWARLPDWNRALVYGGLAYTLVQGMRNPFDGGDGFYGYRLTLELLACAAPAFAMSAHRMGRMARRVFGPLLAFQALVISVGAIDARFGSLADDVWTRHSLLSPLASVPLLLVGFLGACVTIGALGQRLWLRPTPTGRPDAARASRRPSQAGASMPSGAGPASNNAAGAR